MSWPNSVSAKPRPLPGGPSTFPGIPAPANDNWRMPRFNAVPRGPVANDNFPRPPRGLRLPGVARALPVVGTFLTAMSVLDVIDGVIASYREEGELYAVPSHDGIIIERTGEECLPTGGGTHRFPLSSLCQTQWLNRPPDGDPGWTEPIEVPPRPGSATWQVGRYIEPGLLPDYYRWRRDGQGYRARRATFSTPAGTVSMVRDVKQSPRFVLGRAILPSPGFFPPLLNPPAGAAPPVRPGSYKAPRQIFGEWPHASYGTPRRALQPKFIRSQPPKRGERERKVRAKDYAVGRVVEWIVGQTTEGLDMQRALFEALPWWRKMALYNRARELELKYSMGRVIAGRLWYRELTPIEKAQAIYDYIDEIDVAKAMENAIKMTLTDMFWGEIGQRMGRYQVGPWDQHGYNGPPDPDPEWEHYMPDVAPDTTHNHWVYETVVNKRLTRQEAERIHTRYDQYRSQLKGNR